MLPYLKVIADEHVFEMNTEAKIQNLYVSELKVQKADYRNHRVYCNNYKTYFIFSWKL